MVGWEVAHAWSKSAHPRCGQVGLIGCIMIKVHVGTPLTKLFQEKMFYFYVIWYHSGKNS